MAYLNGGLFESTGEWIHPKRMIESNELIYVCRGRVFIEEEGTEYVLEENDILLLERGKTHFGTKASADVAFYWFHFSEDIPAKLVRNAAPQISVLIRQLFHYENSPEYPRRTLDLMLELILTEISVATSDNSASALSEQICEWIRINSGRKITVGEISQKYKYNADYLSRLIKQKKGITLEKYIIKQRLDHCKKMLLSSENNISEIATLCGFESYQLFLKFFEYHEKMSPSAYRKMYSAIHMNNH
jgi:AraC-like DNA-binding protein